jgi:hypothetical protein
LASGSGRLSGGGRESAGQRTAQRAFPTKNNVKMRPLPALLGWLPAAFATLQSAGQGAGFPAGFPHRADAGPVLEGDALCRAATEGNPHESKPANGMNLETAVGMNREPREIRENEAGQEHSLAKNRLTQEVNTSFGSIRFLFAYFAVSTAEFRMKRMVWQITMTLAHQVGCILTRFLTPGLNGSGVSRKRSGTGILPVCFCQADGTHRQDACATCQGCPPSKNSVKMHPIKCHEDSARPFLPDSATNRCGRAQDRCAGDNGDEHRGGELKNANA